MKPFTVTFKPSAKKDLQKLPKQIVQRIYSAIEKLADNPKPTASKKLQGENNKWRMRVGDYRVIYSIYDRVCVVDIVRIRHRQDAYKK